MNTMKRLYEELMDLMNMSDKSVSAFPVNDTMTEWKATIHGVKDTLYEGMEYKLSLEFPKDYPYKAPKAMFSTPCFHPNVDQHGAICLDILKERWTPSSSVRTILLSIQSLLDEPNLDSALNAEAAALWAKPKEYKKKLEEKYQKDVIAKSKK